MPILQDSLQNAAAGVPNPAATAATAPQNIPGSTPPSPQGDAGGGALPPPKPGITCPAVAEHMDDVASMKNRMDPRQAKAFDRIVVAGVHTLYSEQAADAVKQLVLDKEVPMKNKLGEGVANLIVMMDNQGNGSMPKELLIPAGIAIMFEAADYVYECGFDVTEDDLAGGMEILVYGIFEAYGIPREKVDAVLDDMAQKMGFKEGDADKVMEKAQKLQGEEGEAEEEATEPEDNAEEEAAEQEQAFQQGFNEEQQKRGA